MRAGVVLQLTGRLPTSSFDFVKAVRKKILGRFVEFSPAIRLSCEGRAIGPTPVIKQNEIGPKGTQS